MANKLPCPKCGHKTWFEQMDARTWTQRCVCGLMIFILREEEGGREVYRKVVPTQQTRLPEVGTKLHTCFRAVAMAYPETIASSEVITNSGLKSKETGALLVALMARGLIDRIEGRRGLPGGSIWQLSSAAHQAMDIKSRSH